MKGQVDEGDDHELCMLVTVVVAPYSERSPRVAIGDEQLLSHDWKNDCLKQEKYSYTVIRGCQVQLQGDKTVDVD